MELSKLLISNYLPYCKATIVSRAIPSIDGLKPVQRRLLYTMYKLGLIKGNKIKSQKINGATMSLHPHGDSSIYEAMVLISSGYEGMNVPFVESKGSFGKKYSKDLVYAAPRYTEAKLAPICKELFEGINDDAIEFIDNFDGTEKEPTLLPTKFPNILVNNSAGVAVGTSSYIPTFSLKNTCLATIGILEGSIKTPAELAKVLGAPEFTTGGFVHASEKSLEKLCTTGKGSFVISGKVEVYNDKIIVTEVPYSTTAEDIMEAIDKNMKEKKLRGIRDVKDEIGLEGLRIVIEIKGGYNSREVLQELCRLTPLRTSISFRTRVIVENRCRELNLMELLDYWIKFRLVCIQNIYTNKLNRQTKQEHLLSTWEKIKHDIIGVVQMVSKNTDEVAKQKLISTYGLDDEQAEYLMDMKIRSITIDKANESLKKLVDIRNDIKYSKSVIDTDKIKKEIIINDLKEILDNYAHDNLTTLAPEIKEEDNKAPEIKISDEEVTVVLTKDGYLRRLTAIKDIMGKFVSKSGDPEIKRWNIKNNEHILVFDRFGVVHKILVDSIDSSSKSQLTDRLIDLAGIEKIEDIVWIDACGDYSGYFNIIFTTGRGQRVYYSKARGNRAQYKGCFDEVKPGHFWVTTENKFFMITHRQKAAYCDISELGLMSNRAAFKVARVSRGDAFVRLQPAKDVPNLSLINLDKYDKDYTVSIGNDILVYDAAQVEEARRIMELEVERLRPKDETGEASEEENTKVSEEDENTEKLV